MESAPVTLQTCNLAICNAVTHMVDTNLILVNQIIRDRLQTPVVPIQFLVAILTGDGSAGHVVEVLRADLLVAVAGGAEPQQRRRVRDGLPLGGEARHHRGLHSKEAFLESNFGVAKNNYYTYLTAIRECCSKTFDLTNFLSMDLRCWTSRAS
jgi:hypothetical protein